jgi:hypothetical protein
MVTIERSGFGVNVQNIDGAPNLIVIAFSFREKLSRSSFEPHILDVVAVIDLSTVLANRDSGAGVNGHSCCIDSLFFILFFIAVFSSLGVT